jgi:hypothetical protein
MPRNNVGPEHVNIECCLPHYFTGRFPICFALT